MPYDDTDVKKMIKYQTERKVGFSRHKKISAEVKELIHGILEAKTERRFSISDVRQSAWMTHCQKDDCVTPVSALSSSTTTITTRPTNTTTTGTREQAALSVVAEQYESARRAAVVETDRLVDESDDKPTNSVNNNNDKLSRLTEAGVTAIRRQTTGSTADSGTHCQAVTRLARRRDDAAIAALWSAPFVVRDKMRSNGR